MGMSRIWKTLWVTGVALCVGAASAWATHHEAKEGGRRGHAKHFDKRDTDGNGEISKTEWMTAAEERFDKMDADVSGAISKEEWDAGHEGMRKRWREHHGEGH